MPHVFISYLREDAPVVDRLAQELRDCDIQVWIDREEVIPGQLWESATRRAIEEADYFLACFSSSYEQREETYVNEELIVAIEKLRKRRRPIEQSWLIPVLLDKCEVPAGPIGAGKTLRDLHWVDLSENWKDGIDRIVKIIQGKETVIANMPPRAPEDSRQLGTAGEPAIEPPQRPR